MPKTLIGNFKGPKGDRGPQGVQGPQGEKGTMSPGIYYSSAYAVDVDGRIPYETVDLPDGCFFKNGDLVIMNGALYKIKGQGSSGLSVQWLCGL